MISWSRSTINALAHSFGGQRSLHSSGTTTPRIWSPGFSSSTLTRWSKSFQSSPHSSASIIFYHHLTYTILSLFTPIALSSPITYTLSCFVAFLVEHLFLVVLILIRHHFRPFYAADHFTNVLLNDAVVSGHPAERCGNWKLWKCSLSAFQNLPRRKLKKLPGIPDSTIGH